MSGVTLGGAGGYGRFAEVSMGAALLGSNGAAPIGGLIVGGREVVVTTGWLQPLWRNDWGSCGASVAAVGWDVMCGATRGVMDPGGRVISGDGTLGAVVLVSNISASWCSVSSCGSETEANGDAGCGCCSAAIRSFADSIATSNDNVVGMEERRGKKHRSCYYFCACFCHIHFVALVILCSITDVQPL